MKIDLYKVEHQNLIHNNDGVKPYLITEARDGLLQYLDTRESPVYVNSIFRLTSDQIKLYRAYKTGASKVQAAKPGYSAHEGGRGIDLDCYKTKGWEKVKEDLGGYGYGSISTERWHIHYLGDYTSNEEYVINSVDETLTVEEAQEKLVQLGYDDDVQRFQSDYGLQIDGDIGPNTCLQLILLTKEYTFNE